MSAQEHDRGLAERIAAALRRERAAELAARANPPPPRPTGPVPDWLFGPRHRAMDAIRTAARDAARSIVVEPEVLPDLAPPSVAAPAEHCPWCRQPMPDGEP